MHEELFPVQFPVLSGRVLEERILSKYSIMKPFQCKFFTHWIE